MFIEGSYFFFKNLQETKKLFVFGFIYSKKSIHQWSCIDHNCEAKVTLDGSLKIKSINNKDHICAQNYQK